MIDRPRTRAGAVGLPLALIATALFAGCDLIGPPDLVAVTAWSPARISAFEAEIKAEGRFERIRWIRLHPTDTAEILKDATAGADLAIGVPPSLAAELPRAAVVELDRTPIGFTVDRGDGSNLKAPESWADLAGEAYDGRLVLEEGRVDWIVHQAEAAALASGDWAAGYASLVRAAGNARLHGDFGVRPSLGYDGPIDESSEFRSLAGRPVAVDVAAVLKDAPRSEAARALVEALLASGRAKPAAEPSPAPARPLLAELLGATLDAPREELRRAVSALRASSDPVRKGAQSRFLIEAPPWPPASIAKINERPNPEGLLETLAAEIMPDRATRERLLALWRESPRPIDGALLERLATIEGGKLPREPRFRAWLRAEWRAWAAQRYRRVARVASGAFVP